ncbi:choice-of-anchor D domain-containing protein, partial [Desulfococcus multivorans]
TVGLKSDGSVVAAGDNGLGQCSLYDWNLGGVLLPEIGISLDSYRFGEVHWGKTSSTVIAISNTGNDTLNISDVFLNDEYGVFSIDSDISLPIDLEPDQSIDVVINFKPEALQSYIGSLIIDSNDADEASIQVPLSGTGVLCRFGERPWSKKISRHGRVPCSFPGVGFGSQDCEAMLGFRGRSAAWWRHNSRTAIDLGLRLFQRRVPAGPCDTRWN